MNIIKAIKLATRLMKENPRETGHEKSYCDYLSPAPIPWPDIIKFKNGYAPVIPYNGEITLKLKWDYRAGVYWMDEEITGEMHEDKPEQIESSDSVVSNVRIKGRADQGVQQTSRGYSE